MRTVVLARDKPMWVRSNKISSRIWTLVQYARPLAPMALDGSGISSLFPGFS